MASDGEVEEVNIGTGAGWHNVNVWFAPRGGQAQTDTMDTTTVTPTNKEPVGAAYDPVRNELYFSKDGTSGRVWVHDAATGALLRYFDVNVAPYFNADAEGLAFHNGVLYMVDALNTNGTDAATNGNDLLKVLPGPDGVIGAKVTGNDDVVTNYDLEVYGHQEPEGLDVHPVTGNLWIVSNRVTSRGPEPLIEVTPNGVLVSTHSIAAANPHSAGGLAIAPASNGGGGWSVYIADRGVDNNDDPTENDGRIYEFAIGSSEATPTPTPSPTTATPTPTPTPSPTTATPTPTPTQTTPTPTPTPTPTSTPATSNLLENGSFETANSSGQPTSWRTNSGFTRSQDVGATDGSFVGRHHSTADAGWNVYQQVPVTAGQTYAFSGDVNIPTTSDSFKFQIRVQWRGSSNTTVTLKKYTDDTGGAWQTVTSSSLVAPAGATAARIQMVPASLNGDIYVDDFVFAPASP